jgi:hypothetical protein
MLYMFTLQLNLCVQTPILPWSKLAPTRIWCVLYGVWWVTKGSLGCGLQQDGSTVKITTTVSMFKSVFILHQVVRWLQQYVDVLCLMLCIKVAVMGLWLKVHQKLVSATVVLPKRILLAWSRPEWPSQTTNHTPIKELSEWALYMTITANQPAAAQCILFGGELDSVCCSLRCWAWMTSHALSSECCQSQAKPKSWGRRLAWRAWRASQVPLSVYPFLHLTASLGSTTDTLSYNWVFCLC